MVTPQQIDAQRAKETAQRLLSQSRIVGVNATAIQNATPGEQQPQGSAKLSVTITNLGKKIYTLFIPAAANIFQQLTGGCPSSSKIQELITQRNALVAQLNNLGNQLNILTTAVTGLSSFLAISETVISALKTVKSTISVAAKIIPAPPGLPGAVASSLSDLEDAINKLLFDDLGEPRLPIIAGSIASSALSISIVNGYIQQIVAILEAIDLKLQQCAPNLTSPTSLPGLVSINSDLVQIALLQTKAQQTQNQVTYKGFVIEIETVPYTPTVNRHRAVGKNQSGIVLVETELSFTTEFQLLINELKLIIDANNLKAY